MSLSDVSGDCFCGIDIAKRNHQALILDAQGKVLKPAFLVTNAGYRVLVFNPFQIHAYQKSGVRRCKNDKIAAFWIADFARIGHGRPAPETLPALLQLRELSRFRCGLSDQIGDCKRKILCVLDNVFPEYETLFSDVFLTSSRRLLAEAVTAQEFAEFDLSELSRLLQMSSRGRWDAAQAQSKAQTVQTTTRQSVGVPFLADAARMEVGCLLASQLKV